MGKFNWWRRHKKRTILSKKNANKGESYLYQQIVHGDYDPSGYYKQAKQELKYAELDKILVAKTWVASTDALLNKFDEIDRRYIKRHNKLMEDYDKDEHMMLYNLRTGLVKEFGVDVWDKAIKKVGEGDVKALYSVYAKLSKEKIYKHEEVSINQAV